MASIIADPSPSISSLLFLSIRFSLSILSFCKLSNVFSLPRWCCSWCPPFASFSVRLFTFVFLPENCSIHEWWRGYRFLPFSIRLKSVFCLRSLTCSGDFCIFLVYVISFFRWFSIGFHSKTQKLRVKTLKLKGMRHLHASQSADVRALTTCSSLILKQSNPLLSPSPSPYAFALSHNLYVVRNYLSSHDLRFSVSKQ